MNRVHRVEGRRLLRYALTALAVLALAYLALNVLLFFVQRSLIYFPQPRTSMPGTELMQLQTEAGPVLVTVLQRPGAQALIYFGGNAEDVSWNLPTLTEAFPAHSLYLLHYRGYGGSAGQPTEAALLADALALHERVRTSQAEITVIGRSLGSGVAVYLASQRPVDRLVLVTPYESLRELAAQRFPGFPVRWLLKDGFESWRYAAQVSAPTLLIAAERDEVIPLASTRALLTHFPAGVARLEILPGRDHNTVSDSAAYVPLLRGQR
jgi:pimeloyl-ACP methyl ester carboxylesterase